MMIANIHKPIMVDEILSFTDKDRHLKVLDCTFGGGGHTKSFLDKGFTVFAIDKDTNAKDIANKLKKKHNKFSFYQINFKDIEKIVLPFLYNLSKSDEPYIHWPNRGPIIKAQIEKLLKLTRG